jgi:hypothetical protein
MPDRLVPEYLGFPPSVPFHQDSIFNFIIIIILSEEQTGENVDPQASIAL